MFVHISCLLVKCSKCTYASCLLVKCSKCTYASCLLVKCSKCTYASCLLVKCSKCTYAMRKYTSQVVENVTSKRGTKNYEVNIRSIYAIRNCGVGHTGMNRFCGLMNMPHL